jgi:hypothetical protein
MEVRSQYGQIVPKILSQKNPKQKRAGGMAEHVGPEFKHQYHQKNIWGRVTYKEKSRLDGTNLQSQHLGCWRGLQVERERFIGLTILVAGKSKQHGSDRCQGWSQQGIQGLHAEGAHVWGWTWEWAVKVERYNSPFCGTNPASQDLL